MLATYLSSVSGPIIHCSSPTIQQSQPYHELSIYAFNPCFILLFLYVYIYEKYRVFFGMCYLIYINRILVSILWVTNIESPTLIDLTFKEDLLPPKTETLGGKEDFVLISSTMLSSTQFLSSPGSCFLGVSLIPGPVPPLGQHTSLSTFKGQFKGISQ